jgi:hypothetical protein
MNSENEAAAVPCASVGADAGQPLSQKPELSIAEENAECNEPARNFSDMQKLMRRLNDPAYLPTVSMNDLYENVYQSRPPIVDGLLCAGTYLLAGVPKVGKSFLVAQLAYHVSMGLKLWDYEVRKRNIKRSLRLRQRHELRLLAVVQDIQNVVGRAGEKLRVVAVARRVHIPHILEAEEIRHLSGWEEGVRPVAAGEEREAGERDGGELRLVGQCLIGGIAAALACLGSGRLCSCACRSAFGFRRCGGTARGGKGADGHGKRGRERQAHPFDFVHCKRSFQSGAPAPFVKASICPLCEIAVKCATPR